MTLLAYGAMSTSCTIRLYNEERLAERNQEHKPQLSNLLTSLLDCGQQPNYSRYPSTGLNPARLQVVTWYYQVANSNLQVTTAILTIYPVVLS